MLGNEDGSVFCEDFLSNGSLSCLVGMLSCGVDNNRLGKVSAYLEEAKRMCFHLVATLEHFIQRPFFFVNVLSEFSTPEEGVVLLFPVICIPSSSKKEIFSCRWLTGHFHSSDTLESAWTLHSLTDLSVSYLHH